MIHQAIVMVPTGLASPEEEGPERWALPMSRPTEPTGTKAAPTWTFHDIIDETRRRLALRGYRWE